jgi:hypothetical protein
MAEVSVHSVYMYDHVYELLAVDENSCFCKGDNGPMNNTTIKIHKGIDNSVIFRALGPDRVPYDIACTEQVYARITNPENRTIVLEKLCRLGPAKGLITFVADAGDIALIAAGLYNLVLIRTQDFVSGIPGYYIEKPLYSDFADNVAMELEITEQAFKAPLNSITILPENWTPDIITPINSAPMPCFYTARLPGSRVMNHVDSVHSFSVCTQNFTGILEIWGSLLETPDPYLNSSQWFKIYPSSMSQDIEFIGYSGTVAYTYAANVMWIKFRYFPSQEVLDPGILKKLIIRN